MNTLIPPTSPLSSPPPNSPPPPPTSPLSSAPPTSPIPILEQVHTGISYDDSSSDPDIEQIDSDISMPDRPSSTRTPRSTTKRTTSQKLEAVIETLRGNDWSFQDFIRAWVGLRTNTKTGMTKQKDVEVSHYRYKTPEQRKRIMNGIVVELVRFEVLRVPSVSAPALDSVVQMVITELDTLISADDSHFGRFTDAFIESTKVESLDFERGCTSIETSAPIWYRFITRLLGNQRSHRGSYTQTKGMDAAIAKRLFTITSIVCYSRMKKTSNMFPILLGVYLLGTGTKRRVIQSLAGMGLCPSYSHLNKLMEKVADSCKRRLRLLGRNPQTIAVYDNFNFQDTKRDEGVGHTATMCNMTTASLILCPQLPVTGLRQSMHNPTIPLKLRDIFRSPALSGNDQGLGVEISTFLIANAIKKLHTQSVGSIFECSGTFPSMPSIDTIPASRTQYWQFGAIYENEGTIQGTYNVHQRIFVDQLGLRPDTDFNDRLWLVHGDQLTAHHIRSCKTEQQRAQLPFDRRDWLIGVPAWFHIQMNLLNTIIRTHWGAEDSRDEAHHSLLSDIGLWGRSCSSRDNAKYYQIEPILVQSFTSRIAALFYSALRKRRYLTGYNADFFTNPDKVDAIISALTPNQFLELVDDIRKSAFTLGAWEGDGHSDIEFTTMCRMLQEIELFLTVRHAVKHGDIGMLRYLVDPLIVFFFGASQHNYGREMLYYRWLLSDVNTPELQHAILSSGLVNWPGRATTHKPVDLGLEHINLSMAISIRSYKNSTHDTDIIFDRMCLANTWIGILRQRVERYFGEEMSGVHSTLGMESDMFLLARSLFLTDLAEPRSAEQLTAFKSIFLSHDIKTGGLGLLADKVSDFNSLHVRKPGIISTSYPSLHPDDGGDFIDIDATDEVDTDERIIDTIDLTS